MSTIGTRVDVFGPTGAVHRDRRDDTSHRHSSQAERTYDDSITRAQAALVGAEFRLDADRQANARDCARQDRKLIDKASEALARARAGDLLSIVA